MVEDNDIKDSTIADVGSNKKVDEVSDGFLIRPSDFKFILNKFDYGSPVIMTYFIICFVLLFIDALSDVDICKKYLMLPGTGIPFPYPSWQLITHIFGHRDLSHFVGNMSLILLVGPTVEKKYGSFETMTMILTNAVFTGICNGIFFQTGLVGASGVAYMLICLQAMATIRDGKIPLPSLFVMLIYLGVEVLNGIQSTDNVSQFGHITGGIIGIAFGIYCGRNGIIGRDAEHITLKNILEQHKQYKDYLLKTGQKHKKDKAVENNEQAIENNNQTVEADSKTKE